MASDGQKRGILLVDDSESDTELLKGLFRSKDPDLMIGVAMNEGEFLNLVVGKREQSSIPNVDIVLLDFNMPRNEGVAVLKRLKSDPDLRKIPVIVFSGSDSERDIRQAYELGANSYLVKPVAFDELSRIVDLIIHFWLQSACLPNRV
jgi:chemotaxis family two-component system response regulator Rcp1